MSVHTFATRTGDFVVGVIALTAVNVFGMRGTARNQSDPHGWPWSKRASASAIQIRARLEVRMLLILSFERRLSDAAEKVIFDDHEVLVSDMWPARRNLGVAAADAA